MNKCFLNTKRNVCFLIWIPEPNGAFLVCCMVPLAYQLHWKCILVKQYLPQQLLYIILNTYGDEINTNLSLAK